MEYNWDPENKRKQFAGIGASKNARTDGLQHIPFDFCFPYVAAWSCMMLKVNVGELKNTCHLCRASFNFRELQRFIAVHITLRFSMRAYHSVW